MTKKCLCESKHSIPLSSGFYKAKIEGSNMVITMFDNSEVRTFALIYCPFCNKQLAKKEVQKEPCFCKNSAVVVENSYSYDIEDNILFAGDDTSIILKHCPKCGDTLKNGG